MSAAAGIRLAHLDITRSLSRAAETTAGVQTTLERHGLAASEAALTRLASVVDNVDAAAGAARSIRGGPTLGAAMRHAGHGRTAIEEATRMLGLPTVYTARRVLSQIDDGLVRLRRGHSDVLASFARLDTPTARASSPTPRGSAGVTRADGPSAWSVENGRLGERDIDEITGRYPRSHYDEYAESRSSYAPHDSFSGERFNDSYREF